MTLGFPLKASFHAFKVRDSTGHCKISPAGYFYPTAGLVYAGGMTALYRAWYRYDASGRFRFFNDANEWRGMDKLGHFTGTWWAGQWLYESSALAGLPQAQRLKIATGLPLLFMSTVEIFDGFSQGYGFSVADMLANISGSALFFLQQRYLGRQDLLMKISFHRDALHEVRPELLGTSWPETWLKNYNGQTLWMSYPLNKLVGKNTSIPQWLCLSAGYGAGGMLGARNNSWSQGEQSFSFPEIKRYSRYFVSFDIDLLKLPVKGKAWRLFTSTFRWLKVPLPAVEYSGIQGWRFHAFYW